RRRVRRPRPPRPPHHRPRLLARHALRPPLRRASRRAPSPISPRRTPHQRHLSRPPSRTPAGPLLPRRPGPAPRLTPTTGILRPEFLTGRWLTTAATISAHAHPHTHASTSNAPIECACSKPRMITRR